MTSMMLVTSLLACLMGIVPVRNWLKFQPRYYTISLCIYWLSDLLKGFLATFLAWTIAGPTAAYLAAILVVLASFLPMGRGNSLLIAAGAILVFSPILLLIGILAFVISLFATRYLSISTYLTTIAILLFGIVLVAHITVWLVICCLGILVCFDQRHLYQRFRRGLEKPMKW